MNDDGTASRGSENSSNLPIGDGIRAALELLQRARECARDAQTDPWDFALEIGQLYEAGLTITDLRWMVAKQLVQHADEISVHGDEHRSFTPSRGLSFLPTTCVLLTMKGAAFVADGNAAPADESPVGNGKSPPRATFKPHWNAARRELSLGDRTVKQFYVPARNQELVLSAFQLEDWPEFIEDPLADDYEANPKTRLNDVVYRLNHKQIVCLIRFRVNGRGNGVHWSLCAPNTTRRQNRARESLAAE